jgi:hypothetical protein
MRRGFTSRALARVLRVDVVRRVGFGVPLFLILEGRPRQASRRGRAR